VKLYLPVADCCLCVQDHQRDGGGDLPRDRRAVLRVLPVQQLPAGAAGALPYVVLVHRQDHRQHAHTGRGIAVHLYNAPMFEGVAFPERRI